MTQRKLTPERDKLERDGGSVAEERREERGRRAEELSNWEDGVGKTVAGLLSSFHASSVASDFEGPIDWTPGRQRKRKSNL